MAGLVISLAQCGPNRQNIRNDGCNKGAGRPGEKGSLREIPAVGTRAASHLLALLRIAKQHDGDHLDLAVLRLLHAARHPLQHRPRAKAPLQLLVVLSDLVSTQTGLCQLSVCCADRQLRNLVA